MAWHWRSALIDGALLAMFMVSASVFGVLLFHPGSRAVRCLPSDRARRAFMGIAMGGTAVALVYSPLGRASGAHMNPAVTIAFFSLGTISAIDAALYCVAQVLGGLSGITLAWVLLRSSLKHPAVNFVATLPGSHGVRGAAVAEFVIAFTQLLIVLIMANSVRTHPYTGLLAGVMLAGWIYWLAPVSGMSMNPARTLASAVLARQWRGIWVYLVIPPAAMTAAAAVYVQLDRHVFCAKVFHSGVVGGSCPFRCEFGDMQAHSTRAPSTGN